MPNNSVQAPSTAPAAVAQETAQQESAAQESVAQESVAPESPPRKPLSPAARRALAEAEARRKAIDEAAAGRPKEIDGRGGLEPVRYGDWEIKGLASDF